MSDAIKAALDAAARMACYGGISGDRCDQCTDPSQCRNVADWTPGTTAAIAAFLDALHAAHPDDAYCSHELAAAVRRAGGGA